MQIDIVFKYIFGLGPPGYAFIEASKKEFEITRNLRFQTML